MVTSFSREKCVYVCVCGHGFVGRWAEIKGRLIEQMMSTCRRGRLLILPGVVRKSAPAKEKKSLHKRPKRVSVLYRRCESMLNQPHRSLCSLCVCVRRWSDRLRNKRAWFVLTCRVVCATRRSPPWDHTHLQEPVSSLAKILTVTVRLRTSPHHHLQWHRMH